MALSPVIYGETNLTGPLVAGPFFVWLRSETHDPLMMMIMNFSPAAHMRFRANLWPEHSWRVQIATSRFHAENNTQRKRQTPKTTR